MVQSVNVDYTAENAKYQKTPAWIASFSGVTTKFTTHVTGIVACAAWSSTATADESLIVIPEARGYLTTGLVDDFIDDLFGTGVGAPLLTNRSAYMKIPKVSPSRIIPDEGKASIGVVTLEIPDVDGDMTALVMQGIIGKTVTIQTGYAEFDEGDFEDFAIGFVKGVRLAADLGSYLIDVRDPWSLVNRDVFETSSTLLDGAHTDVVTTITVDSTTGWLTAGAGRLNDEIFTYSGVTATTFTGVTRGAYGTTATAHSDNDPCLERIVLTGGYGAIANTVLTATDKTGLAIAAGTVDSAGFTAADTGITAITGQIVIEGPENALSFLHREVFKPAAAYPVVTSGGKLSIKVAAAPATSVATITDDDILTDGQGSPRLSWSGNIDSLVNVFTLRYHVDPISQQFTTTTEYVDQPSIDLYGRKPFIVESKALRNGETTFMEGRRDVVLPRYKNSSPVITVETHMTKHLLELGDVIALTSAHLPNRSSHGRGLTSSLCEIVRKEVNFTGGFVKFELLQTGFDSYVTDDFNRTDTTLAAEGDANGWTVNEGNVGNFAVVSNQMFIEDTSGSGGAFGTGFAYRNFTFDADQFSELVYKSGVADGESGPAVRIDTSGGFLSATLYCVIYENDAGPRLVLRKYVAEGLSGGGTELGEHSVTLSADDVVRINVDGSSLNVYLNDSLVIGPITDSAIVAGKPGMVATQGTASADLTWDDYTGGDTGWAP